MHPQQDDPEGEISWADTMEDLERQKQIIQDQAKTQTSLVAPESGVANPL